MAKQRVTTTPDGSRYTPDPIRIDHRGVRVPPPTPQNMEAMAIKAWQLYSQRMGEYLTAELPEWAELPPARQDIWLAVAKNQYSMVVLLGGGKIEIINAQAE